MKTIKFFAIAAILLGFSTISFAQSNATAQYATASSSATIIAPLTIEKIKDLEFGKLVGKEASAVTIEAKENAKANGNNVIVGNVSNPAQFDIVGAPGATYKALLTSGKITLTSGSNSMLLTLSKSVGDDQITLNSEGKATIYVGGSLAVAANQAAGEYKNKEDLKVTVAYE